jgi:hypothetical protein
MVQPGPRDDWAQLPSEPTRMLVTPQIAQSWLEKRQLPKSNRRISALAVNRYVNAMLNGEWRLTPHGIIFDTEGYLIDGQHRLRAVVISQTEQEFWVYPHEPRDLFDVIDTGRARKAAQFLHAPNSITLVGAARFLAVADNLVVPRTPNAAYAELTNTMTFEVIRHWGVDLEEAARMANIARASRIPVSPFAAVMAQALRTEHKGRVPAFVEAIGTGYIAPEENVDLGREHPVLRLRNAYTGYNSAAAKRTRSQPYSLVVKAWNAYVENRKIRALGWREDEKAPRVIGYTPKQDKPLLPSQLAEANLRARMAELED